ncbi:uncharacterized protein C10orf67 homolog, mitochondrial [Chanos chanos]|uniref:Uncharacterized protein C10orf67 homolog, mitochondrial n=1 Tax=Chanos chanos TaxID=29144 RepID=A0A6J2V959_CHACN|nr:uncharacterized protein C10orf67 homolog, mitochondrial [Chanos chanos]
MRCSVYRLRYSLGNQLWAPFLHNDVCTQTDVEELPTIKLLSETTAQLTTSMEILRKELMSKVKFILAQNEARLQQEAESLYEKICSKLKSLEHHHKEKVSVLRASYKQQLSQAIQVVRANYMRDKGETVEVTQSEKIRTRDMVGEIQEKDLQIESLMEQIKEYEEKLLTQNNSEGEEDAEKEWLREENRRLKDKIDSLHVEMDQIHLDLDSKEAELEDLALNVQQLKSKAEEDKKAFQKLTNDSDLLKAQLHLERESGKKKIKELQQKMEKEIESIEKSHKSEQLAVEKKYKEQRQAEKERQKEVVLAQEAAMKAQAATGREQLSEETDLLQKLHELRNTETVQKKLIIRLEKKLDLTNQMWEKKFEILRESFHTIKDEMFLRHMLQRQAAMLHQASVSYTPGIGAGGPQKTDKSVGTTRVRALSQRGTRELPRPESRLEAEAETDEDLGAILPLSLPLPSNRQNPASAVLNTNESPQ